MAAIYPELIADRDVALVSGNETAPAHMRAWSLNPSQLERYRLELTTATGTYEATAFDMFEALVVVRRSLERAGWLVALQGARRDCYPSGMARDMGGGLRIYVMRPGEVADLEDMVDTLDDAEAELLATVEEQEACFNAWFEDGLEA